MSRLAGYRRPHPGTQPDYDYPPYVSTGKRHPTQPLVLPPQTLSELTGPIFGRHEVKATDNDLTRQHKREPIGERIIVSGRVLDEDGKAVPHTLIEIWQANAAGRYPHPTDRHDAPLDPNFSGAGRTLTDAKGRYRFITIRPGEYPWQNPCIADENARKRLISTFDLETTVPQQALGYRFDIVLRGREATPMEQ